MGIRDNDSATKEVFNAVGATWLSEKSDPRHTSSVINILEGYIDRDNAILDICCGYGRIALPLIGLGYNVKGIDISEELIKGANHLLNKDDKKDIFKVANMKELPFNSNSFDFSFCVWASFNFLNTVEGQLESINEMYRVLKKGGKSLIECPFHEEESVISKSYVGTMSYDYFPITIGQFEAIGRASKFPKYEVFTREISGRKRIIALFTK